jgi:hypothetical protein
MVYNYVCKKCRKKIDIEIPMGQDLPKEKECACGGKATHDFKSQVLSQGQIIPGYMRATDVLYNGSQPGGDTRNKIKKSEAIESIE